MIVDAWLTSLMVKPPVILGRRLKPFSLAHSLILDRLENPFWVGGKRGPEHFFEVLEVCANNLEGNRARMYAKPRRFRRWVAAKFRKVKDADIDALNNYIVDHTACCARESSGGAGRDMASPWEFRVATYLIEYGFPEERAWNMPFNLARCYFDAREEMNGDETLVPFGEECAVDLITRANELMQAGHTKEADELYAKAQRIFDEKNNARRALEQAVKP